MAGAAFRGPLLICLLNLNLNEKSSLHSLQFMLKYHVSLDYLWAHIWGHTHRNLGPAALYWSRIRKFVTYRIRKNVTENRQTDREQTEKPITEATLIQMDRWLEQANKIKCLVSMIFNKQQDFQKSMMLYNINNQMINNQKC